MSSHSPLKEVTLDATQSTSFLHLVLIQTGRLGGATWPARDGGWLSYHPGFPFDQLWLDLGQCFGGA